MTKVFGKLTFVIQIMSNRSPKMYSEKYLKKHNRNILIINQKYNHRIFEVYIEYHTFSSAYVSRDPKDDFVRPDSRSSLL